MVGVMCQVSDWFKARIMKEDSNVICVDLSAWKRLSYSLWGCCDGLPQTPSNIKAEFGPQLPSHSPQVSVLSEVALAELPRGHTPSQDSLGRTDVRGTNIQPFCLHSGHC